MLPKWFNVWNKENPTNVFGPAILVGVLGGAVFGAIMIVTWGQPAATSSLQTGPRGIGMSVTEFDADLNTPDPDIGMLYENEPYIPDGSETLAKDIYQNVQVLGDVTEDNFNHFARHDLGIERIFAVGFDISVPVTIGTTLIRRDPFRHSCHDTIEIILGHIA